MNEFMVKCFYEPTLATDFIIETAKSYGATMVSIDIAPRCNYGKIKIVSNEPDLGQLIYLCADGIPLSEFEHPEQATYMIGKNSEHGEFLPKHAIKVKVDTPVDFPLWNFIALGLVLDDRIKKQSTPHN